MKKKTLDLSTWAVWRWGTFQLCKSILWTADFLLIVIKLLYSLPPSVGQSAAGLRQVTSGKRPGCTQGHCSLSFHSTAGCWSPSRLQTARRQLFHSLCNALWVLHTPLSLVQVPSVSLWSTDGFSGSRSLEEAVGAECRSEGSHTGSALLSRSFNSVAFS